MRVAHFMPHFSGLSESFIYDYVVELQRQGAGSCVITPRRENATARPFEPLTVLPPSPLECLYRQQPFRSLRYRLPPPPYKLTINRRALRKALHAFRADVIHAQFGQAGVAIVRLAKDLQIPLVVTFLGLDISLLPQDPRWPRMYKQLFQTATDLIAISHHVASRLAELGAPREKIHVIHLGIPIEKFPYSDPVTRFDGKTVRCLFVGRLVEKKDPLTLIAAFDLARRRLAGRRNLTLTIAGDGPLRPTVEAAVSERGLTGCVTICGAVSHEQIPVLFQSSHIYTQHCVTSADGDQEGLGVTFAEASATGLPIVSTRHNGIPDVVLDGQTGFLVAEKDAAAMADRIAHLAMDPADWTRLGRNGQAHISANFRLETQTRKVMELFREVTGKQ